MTNYTKPENGSRTIEAIPGRFLSRKFSIEEMDRPIARVELNLFSFRRAAKIFTFSEEFDVYKVQYIPEIVELRSQGEGVICSIKRKKIFSSTFIFEYRDLSVEIRLKLFSLKECFQLFSGEKMVGVIGLKKIFSRRMLLITELDLPDHVNAFLLWFGIQETAANQSDSSAAT